MKNFIDRLGNKVELSFSSNAFGQEAKHVLVICKYLDDWLLTMHSVRGLEFPGGKMEPGESLKEAAIREVYEETGATLEDLTQIAEYRVADEKNTFVKAVFWGKINSVHKMNSYFETKGPVLIKGDLLDLRFGEEFSFIMKDDVVAECIKYIYKVEHEKE
ncbi:8-oxo-dGTP diphosphatase [Neobacillus niacini]|uniref:RNA deprotection pyrophosphohydrolase n=1 Tax=Neobacillus driksii TaxID=3035913 RepID=UPI002788B3AD|nr:nucleoside triphosphatase YtkD [Neobacillus niacini]MDQ0975462.1 8-oxo-dGTP diphosphatase [Neobacillus niacini]